MYNGERYLGRAIETLLNQTFADFTLCISDNGSTDGTADIARLYVAADLRVRFESHTENRGAAWNFNRVFTTGTAPLFKWAAADDLHEPTFLARCIEVIDREPEVSVVYCATRYIDANEQPTFSTALDDFHRREARPHQRLHCLLGTYPMHVMFGVGRRPLMAKTRLWGSFASADRVLVSELALQGQIFKIDDRLFVRRFHDEMSWYPETSQRDYAIWYDPRNANGIMVPANLRRGLEYARGVRHAGLSVAEERRCHTEVLRHALWFHGLLAVNRRIRRLLSRSRVKTPASA